MKVTMDARIKGLWLQALRSGNYKQGRKVLKQIDAHGNARYCCLGVLCDLAVKEGVATEYTEPGGNISFESDNSSIGTLPYGVKEWAGIEGMSTNGHDENEKWPTGLAIMNDGDVDGAGAKTFEEIADFIEAHIEAVS